MADTAPRTRPKIERLPPLPPAPTNYHRTRRRVHLVCFLIFVALPFFNIMRADIPRQRFWFAGYELWINEFGIIFFALMFLMFVIAASAIIHGRIYCSYMCPQMIFSEWSCAVEEWSRKLINKRYPKWPVARKNLAAGAIWYGALAVVSIFLAFVFTSYFVEPRDLLGRLLRFDIQTAGGITGAVVTLITFLDFTLVRQKFCTTICPYGYLQGMLQDKQTLLVTYRDGKEGEKICIECGKCVRVCEMGIDIRKSPYQIECVHCGDCIDSCEDVLRRIGRPGLIHYAWGEHDTLEALKKEPWYRRLGFRDSKRIVLVLVLLFYLCGLGVALSMRRPVLVRMAPDRTRLYTETADGRIANTIRMTLANRSSQPVLVKLSVEGLGGAEIVLPQNPVPLAAGEAMERRFEIRVPRSSGTGDVNPIRLIAQPSNESAPDTFELTFIMPVQAKGN